MRNSKIKFGSHEYDFALTIGTFAPLEKELGQSLISLITNADGKVLTRFTVENMKTILKYCLVNGPKSDDDIYQLMQDFCDNGGTLDELAGLILVQLVSKTNFFLPEKVKVKE